MLTSNIQANVTADDERDEEKQEIDNNLNSQPTTETRDWLIPKNYRQ